MREAEADDEGTHLFFKVSAVSSADLHTLAARAVSEALPPMFPTDSSGFSRGSSFIGRLVFINADVLPGWKGVDPDPAVYRDLLYGRCALVLSSCAYPNMDTVDGGRDGHAMVDSPYFLVGAVRMAAGLLSRTRNTVIMTDIVSCLAKDVRRNPYFRLPLPLLQALDEEYKPTMEDLEPAVLLREAKESQRGVWRPDYPAEEAAVAAQGDAMYSAPCTMEEFNNSVGHARGHVDIVLSPASGPSALGGGSPTTDKILFIKAGRAAVKLYAAGVKLGKLPALDILDPYIDQRHDCHPSVQGKAFTDEEGHWRADDLGRLGLGRGEDALQALVEMRSLIPDYDRYPQQEKLLDREVQEINPGNGEGEGEGVMEGMAADGDSSADDDSDSVLDEEAPYMA
jgi:hypothetical protein